MDNQQVLIIDADKRRSRVLAAFLTSLDIPSRAVPDLTEALPAEAFFDGASALVIALPGLPALAVGWLKALNKKLPRPAVVVMAEARDSTGCLSLLQEGAADQVCGLDSPLGIFSALKSELARRRLFQENETHVKNLARLRAERSRDARRARELEEIYDTTVENLMMALDLRDVETFGHSQTVAKYSQVLAEILGIPRGSVLDNIRKGALLHDVGKIAIPDSILKKPGRLTSAEWEKIRFHPVLGFGLIKEIKLLEEAAVIILYHHEKYDGSGYPKGLKKEGIPLEARVFALADALDAITSPRPYRSERDFQAAKREIELNSGSHFDPRVVEAFSSLETTAWEKIRFETTRILPAFEEYRRLSAKTP